MSRNFVGKKPDTFSLGWGNDLNQGQNQRQHPLKKNDQFSLGWGQTFESEKPRNSFNPHTVMQQDYNVQAFQNKQRNGASDIFNQNIPQMKQAPDSLEQLKNQYQQQQQYEPDYGKYENYGQNYQNDQYDNYPSNYQNQYESAPINQKNQYEQYGNQQNNNQNQYEQYKPNNYTNGYDQNQYQQEIQPIQEDPRLKYEQDPYQNYQNSNKVPEYSVPQSQQGKNMKYGYELKRDNNIFGYQEEVLQNQRVQSNKQGRNPHISNICFGEENSKNLTTYQANNQR